MIQALKDKFRSLFGSEELLVRSPGRVNLIGEHVDYNNGFVLPAALQFSINLAISKRPDSEIHLYSLDYDDSFKTSLNTLEKSGKLWPDFLLGVADQLQKKGKKLQGFNIVFGGDIPQGAGLSSSAALECATGFALNKLFDLGISKLELAQISQKAENDFVGLKCGLMDQFASVFGEEESLIKLDCQNFSYEYIPFHAPGMKLLLLDSQVKHSLASTAYNERREQCEAGVALIKRHLPDVTSLRQATEEMLLQWVRPVDELIYRRCSFIVAEIQRVQDAADDLRHDDLISFGKKMFEAHEGLQHWYEVSCTEIDCLVDLVRAEPAVLGARIMGGGFGGCTINLVKEESIEELIARVSKAYKQATGLELKAYVAQIGRGTSLIS